LRDLLRKLREDTDSAESKKRERLSIEFNAPEADAKKKALQDISEEIGKLKNRRDAETRIREATTGLLAQKRQELGRHTDAIGKGQVPLRRADRAAQIATTIESLLDEAVPSQVAAVSAAMTDAYRAMARKRGLVDRIEITADCEVRL